MSRRSDENFSPFFVRLIKGQGSRKIVMLAFTEMMIFLAGGLVFLTICACLMLLNNTVRTPPEPLEYNVIELSPCSGWSDTGAAQKKQVFRPDEEHIFACGHIETNHPSILITVYWDYEGQQIHREVIKDVRDQFRSELPPMGEDFAAGNYEVRLVIGRETVGRAEFEVVP